MVCYYYDSYGWNELCVTRRSSSNVNVNELFLCGNLVKNVIFHKNNHKTSGVKIKGRIKETRGSSKLEGFTKNRDAVGPWMNDLSLQVNNPGHLTAHQPSINRHAPVTVREERRSA
jgi:hypothetical protein